MNYKLTEVPHISDSYRYQNDDYNQRVLCSSTGQIKILNCDPTLLEEVLANVDGKRSFEQIIGIFSDRFDSAEVKNFLNEIFNEGILVTKAKEYKKLPSILVIGDGIIAEKFTSCKYIGISDFLSDTFNYE